MIIYHITNKLNGKVYIGQTVRSLDVRIKQHINTAMSGCSYHLYRAIRKYGWENFEYGIVAYADNKEQLNQLEMYYIQKYDSIRNGYNMVPGGDMNVMDYEPIAKHHDEVMRTPEVRNKISVSMKRYCAENGVSEEHRRHLSENKKAFYASERGKLVRANFSATFKLSDSHKMALINSLKKSVYCVDMQNHIIAEFDSVKSAAVWWLANGLSPMCIKSVCGKIKRSYLNNEFMNGIKWIYRV